VKYARKRYPTVRYFLNRASPLDLDAAVTRGHVTVETAQNVPIRCPQLQLFHHSAEREGVNINNGHEEEHALGVGSV